jgi:hypothetical protein
VEDIKAIDIMNYPFTAEGVKGWMANEFQIMARTIFKGRQSIEFAPKTPAQFVAEMDEAGYDKVFICGCYMFSHRDKKLIWDYPVDVIHQAIKDYPDRLIGIAGYNPLRIEESLRDIEKAVKEYGFKGVYFHSLSFNLPLNDRKLYPCYAKCNELGVPVAMQTGHSLETLPSEPGRPIYIDEVALDFPNLKIVLSHTGWPWCEEFIAMAWKHENVYCDISAHMPRYLDPSLVRNMDTRMRDKVLFGTNNLGLKHCKDQFMEMNIKDDTKRMVLRDNAVRLYKL